MPDARPWLNQFSLPLLAAACAACTPAPPPPAPPALPPPPPTVEAPASQTIAPPLPYPKTRTVDVSDTRFGITVRDPYRWLEDGASPEVQAWVAAQDKLARDMLAGLPGRDALRERLRALSYLESVSPPKKRGGRTFFSRRLAGKEKRSVYVREGDKGEERVLLDGEALSADSSAALGYWVPSYDGKKIAYVLHPNSADAGIVHVRNIATGKERAADVIDGAKYAIPQWTPRSDGFYYVALPTDPKIPQADLPGYSEVKLHRLGAPAKSDAVVFPKTGDPETELEVHLSRDGHWLTVAVIRGSSIVTDLHVRDMRRPRSTWTALVKGHDGVMDATVWKDRIYLRTSEGAPRGRVFRIDPAKPARDQWKEVIPEEKDAVLTDARVVGNHLALAYTRDARSELRVRTLDGAQPKAKALTLPGIGTSGGFIGEPDDDTAYYYFMSYTTPGAIYKTRMSTGDTELWYALKADVDPSAYEVEQVWYPSKDGTKISMFIAHKKGAPRDGSVPFLLSGYGGFNISMTPYFDPQMYVWLESGGAVAMPNLRGGGEYGEAWHRAGMLGEKQNVFDDFIAAAEYLIQNKLTRPDRLAISGGSNGGLLVGAAMTQRPDLFRVVLCGVPVLDMIRYPLFGDGKTWLAEYGSPDEEAAFKALYAYSPYHRVKPGTAYPAVLILSADADDRVAPLHAWKMTAALQAASTSGRPVLMRVERHSGHRGADQVKSRVERAVDSIAFAMHAMGVTPAGR